MRLQRKTAFTLIELLVVISIITLLMSILLPCLGLAREKAKRVACMANLRSIGQAIFVYAHDNDDKLIPGDFCVPWDVWGWRSEGLETGNKTYRQVNLGYLLTTGTLPMPGNNDHVFFCPSFNRAVDGSRPSENFSRKWGSADTQASITYMFNNALDGFGNYVQQGNQAVLSHKDKINFLLADGSVQVFNVKPLVFDEAVGPELLQEVSARTGTCFPSAMLYGWLEAGEVNLAEAGEYLVDPSVWTEIHSSLSVSKPVMLANINDRALVCDVVGALGGSGSDPPKG